MNTIKGKDSKALKQDKDISKMQASRNLLVSEQDDREIDDMETDMKILLTSGVSVLIEVKLIHFLKFLDAVVDAGVMGMAPNIVRAWTKEGDPGHYLLAKPMYNGFLR
jgi:hypothetical protein